MPIVFNARTTQVFMKNAWVGKTEEEKQVWRDKAISLLYPDLRTGYDFHDEMVETMAQALYECHVYSKHGGGRLQTGTNSKRAIYESADPDDTTYNVTALRNPHEREFSYYKGNKLVKPDPNKPHTMGEPVPGHYFAFVEETKVISYHTMTLRNMTDEKQAEETAQQLIKRGFAMAKTSQVLKTDIAIRPMREKHVEHNKDTPYTSEMPLSEE